MNKFLLGLFLILLFLVTAMFSYLFVMQRNGAPTIKSPKNSGGTQVVSVNDNRVAALVKKIGGEMSEYKYSIEVHEGNFPSKENMLTFQILDKENTENIASGCQYEIEGEDLDINIHIDRSEYEKWIPEEERQDKLNRSIAFCFIEIQRVLTGTPSEDPDIKILKKEIFDNVDDKYMLLEL